MKVLKDSREIIKEKFTSTEVSEIPAQKKVKPVEETKPTKRKWWKGTLFKCKVGCRYPYWDSEGNDYDKDGNLITKLKPVEKTKPKKKGKWECIVPPCDFIDEDGNMKE